MKISPQILSFLILVVVSFSYTGCKKDDDNSDTLEKKQLDKLVGDWTLQSANDGTDRTQDFLTEENEALILHLQGNYVEGGTYNYSFTGKRPNPSPWPESGTWKFDTADKATEIIRDPGGADETIMNYSVTDTELIISFEVTDGHPGWEGGVSRTKNVIGEWTFTFSK